MEIIINENNLKPQEIEEHNSKVRAILIDNNNQILIANYGNVILLPGGTIDAAETPNEAIKRELNEELGQQYNSEELDFFITLNYYQKDYPKRDGTFKNRLVQTHYFIGLYKGIKIDSQKLTEKEQKDNFTLELVTLDDLESIVLKNKTDNPRNIFFQIELLTILNFYKNIKQNTNIKKLELK